MIAEYVASILAARGFMPVHAPSLALARQRLAQPPPFDLCLCDRWLPDGEGTALLADLQSIPSIAMSAHLDSGDDDHLRGAGFVDVLLKPCSPEALERSVRAALAGRASVRPDTAPADAVGPVNAPVLDDAAALRMSGGDREVMHRLRALLLAELPAIRARLQDDNTSDDGRSALAAELHKLAASAGWCGATELAFECDALRRHLFQGDRGSNRDEGMLLALDRLQQALTAEASPPS